MINRLYLKRQNERFKQRPKLTEPRDTELAAQCLLSSMQKRLTALQGWCVGESLGQSLGHKGHTVASTERERQRRGGGHMMYMVHVVEVNER